MDKIGITKHLQKVRGDDGLNIAIECSLKIENYLHVILSWNDGTFSPYQKLDNTYILSS